MDGVGRLEEHALAHSHGYRLIGKDEHQWADVGFGKWFPVPHHGSRAPCSSKRTGERCTRFVGRPHGGEIGNQIHSGNEQRQNTAMRNS